MVWLKLSQSPTKRNGRQYSRWVYLSMVMLANLMIGLYQYSWTLFALPIRDEFGWQMPAIQLTFTLCVWIMTWSQPISGFFMDRRGPKLLTTVAALLCGFGWIAASYVDSIWELYVVYGLGSIGVGIFYAAAVGVASKWFPEKRGLAIGLAIFSYGFGAAIFNPIISFMIHSVGFRWAFLSMGIIMLVILLSSSQIIKYPYTSQLKQTASLKFTRDERQFTPREMIMTWQWWLIYLAFIFTANTGLMVASQMTAIGEAFNIPEMYILITATSYPIMNGLGRIIGGVVSDRIGRERTMSLYCATQGLLSLALLSLGFNPLCFILLLTLIGTLWGPIFTFVPSIIADYYGRENSTANYGITYTAKAWGGVMGGYVTAWLASYYRGFATPIILSAILALTASIMVNPYILKRPTKK